MEEGYSLSFISPTGSSQSLSSTSGRCTNPHSLMKARGTRAPVTLQARRGEARACAQGFRWMSDSLGSGRRFFLCSLSWPGRGLVRRGDWGRSEEGRRCCFDLFSAPSVAATASSFSVGVEFNVLSAEEAVGRRGSRVPLAVDIARYPTSGEPFGRKSCRNTLRRQEAYEIRLLRHAMAWWVVR